MWYTQTQTQTQTHTQTHTHTHTDTHTQTHTHTTLEYYSAMKNNKVNTICGNMDGPAPAAAKSLQSCTTLWDHIDGSPPGSPIPRILQARTLEWVAISFSNA